MTCQDYEAYIDDYVDGTLAQADRTACDGHLSTCVVCQAMTTDLQTIREATRSLEPHVPSPQVWYRLAAAIDAESRGGAAAWFGGWRAAVAAVTCVLLVGSLSWIGGRLAPIARDQNQLTSVEPATTEGADFASVEEQYIAAIMGLEDITSSERTALDAMTAEVLQASLTVIDGAIGESRAALDKEPESSVAQESLVEALRSKIALLQDTVALINEMRQADTDGTAGTDTGINQ
jgi:anti-sigma factor RsiW